MPFSAENLTEVETFLSSNQFLSGKDLPGADDLQVLQELNANGTIPDFTHPNLFGWFWCLNLFSPPARALWGSSADTTQASKGGKGKAKNSPKKVVAPVAKVEEDDFDLFGDETEEDVAAVEALKKKQVDDAAANKKKKPAVIAKSSVTFDVKGYELGQDFEALA